MLFKLREYHATAAELLAPCRKALAWTFPCGAATYVMPLGELPLVIHTVHISVTKTAWPLTTAPFILAIETYSTESRQKNFRLVENITMSTTVHVEGISPQTSEKEVRDFFSFWYVMEPVGIKTSY